MPIRFCSLFRLTVQASYDRSLSWCSHTLLLLSMSQPVHVLFSLEHSLWSLVLHLPLSWLLLLPSFCSSDLYASAQHMFMNKAFPSPTVIYVTLWRHAHFRHGP